MNQTTGVESLDLVLALVAAILTYAWIRGIVEPTPAALELLQQAHDDYAASAEHRARAAAADRAAYLNQVATARRQHKYQQDNAILHQDGTDGVA